MALKLFNSFQVKEQDFCDINCSGCMKNGQNFDCLLLCADCGNFFCDKCMLYHLKHLDKNHNSTLNKKHNSTKEKEIDLDRSDKSPGNANLRILKGEVETEISSLKKQLQNLHSDKADKLKLVQKIGEAAYEKIAEFREQVIQELNEVEVEIRKIVDLETAKICKELSEEMAKAREKIITMDSLMEDSLRFINVENRNTRNTDTQEENEGQIKKLKELLNDVQTEGQHFKEAKEAEVNLAEYEEKLGKHLLQLVQEPLEYFSYRVNKLNVFQDTSVEVHDSITAEKVDDTVTLT